MKNICSYSLMYRFSFIGEKRVSFDEFVPIYLHAQKNKTARKQGFEHFVEGFKIFDRDGNGLVSAAEIRHILTSLGRLLKITRGP